MRPTSTLLTQVKEDALAAVEKLGEAIYKLVA
jgi:hypothetical protein